MFFKMFSHENPTKLLKAMQEEIFPPEPTTPQDWQEKSGTSRNFMSNVLPTKI